MTENNPTSNPKVCPICAVNDLQGAEQECSACRSITPGAYKALQETEPCHRCGEGETWSVKGPDGAWIGQSWTGENSEYDAGEMASALNAAYELGMEAAERPADETSSRPDAACLAAVPELKGKNAVVLYFETPEDRDELVALIHVAKPGMRAVNL